MPRPPLDGPRCALCGPTWLRGPRLARLDALEDDEQLPAPRGTLLVPRGRTFVCPSCGVAREVRKRHTDGLSRAENAESTVKGPS